MHACIRAYSDQVSSRQSLGELFRRHGPIVHLFPLVRVRLGPLAIQAYPHVAGCGSVQAETVDSLEGIR
jgi:hypothetical protein